MEGGRLQRWSWQDAVSASCVYMRVQGARQRKRPGRVPRLLIKEFMDTHLPITPVSVSTSRTE
jgi:hypothetical protein